MTNLQTEKAEYLDCYRLAVDELSSLILDIESERILKGAALTLLFVRKYSGLINYHMTQKDVENALLVGALIEPYDSAMDSDTIEDSILAAEKFLSALNDDDFKPQNARENQFAKLYSKLCQNMPKSKNPGFYEALAHMHAVETLAILQKRGSGDSLLSQDSVFSSPLTDDQLKEIMELKGGCSMLLFASIIDQNLGLGHDAYELLKNNSAKNFMQDYLSGKIRFNFGTETRARATLELGALVQSMDDFGDFVEDSLKDIETYSMRTGFFKSLKTTIGIRRKLSNLLCNKQENSAFSSYLEYADFYIMKGLAKYAKQKIKNIAATILSISYTTIMLPVKIISQVTPWKRYITGIIEGSGLELKPVLMDKNSNLHNSATSVLAGFFYEVSGASPKQYKDYLNFCGLVRFFISFLDDKIDESSYTDKEKEDILDIIAKEVVHKSGEHSFEDRELKSLYYLAGVIHEKVEELGAVEFYETFEKAIAFGKEQFYLKNSAAAYNLTYNLAGYSIALLMSAVPNKSSSEFNTAYNSAFHFAVGFQFLDDFKDLIVDLKYGAKTYGTTRLKEIQHLTNPRHELRNEMTGIADTMFDKGFFMLNNTTDRAKYLGLKHLLKIR